MKGREKQMENWGKEEKLCIVLVVLVTRQNKGVDIECALLWPFISSFHSTPCYALLVFILSLSPFSSSCACAFVGHIYYYFYIVINHS